MEESQKKNTLASCAKPQFPRGPNGQRGHFIGISEAGKTGQLESWQWRYPGTRWCPSSLAFSWFISTTTTWWFIPLSKWVTTLVINGIGGAMSTYNWGYNPLTKWDEPPSTDYRKNAFDKGSLEIDSWVLGLSTWSVALGQERCAKHVVFQGLSLLIS